MEDDGTSLCPFVTIPFAVRLPAAVFQPPPQIDDFNNNNNNTALTPNPAKSAAHFVTEAATTTGIVGTILVTNPKSILIWIGWGNLEAHESVAASSKEQEGK